jgi:dTMP kinase
MEMLLAIEGIDGSGKGTQTRLIEAQARREGWRVATLSFPRYGETFFADAVGKYLDGAYGTLDEVPAQFAALLYAGDRLESLPHLRQLQKNHDLVILDRYVASNLAYQAARITGSRRQKLLAWIDRLEHEVHGLPRADLTIYFDMPARQATELVHRKQQRSYTRRKADLHEADLKFLQATRRVYLKLATSRRYGRWHSIACTNGSGRTLEPDDICGLAWQRVARELARR